MTAGELRELGQAFYGPEWQSPLARALGVSARTVRRWASGASPISVEIRGRILLALHRRQRELAQECARARQLLLTIT